MELLRYTAEFFRHSGVLEEGNFHFVSAVAEIKCLVDYVG